MIEGAGLYTPPAPANFRDWKHSLQKTGRPCVGRKGTVVSLPQAEQVVWVSTRSRIEGPALARFARFALHDLQRFGSFLNCLSAKKSCSPAVQVNSAAQSTHLRVLSWKSIGRHLVLVVPRRRAGIRLMLNAHQTVGDIRGLVREIAERLHTRPRVERFASVETS